jgi:hypothetical protein
VHDEPQHVTFVCFSDDALRCYERALSEAAAA